MVFRERSAESRRRWAIWADDKMDSLNPILVRETRQILKSRHFVVTFQLTLIGAWISALVIAGGIGPSIIYQESGPTFFTAFYLALLFALHLAVPFGTYLNFASEYDRDTIDMLTITTLSPPRILAGKLQCSCLQMGTYASTLVPFLALTWLLGGLGLLPIFGGLLFGFLNSFALCTFACMLGVIARGGFWQGLATGVLLIGCLLVFAGTASLALTLFAGGILGWVCFLVFYLFAMTGFLSVVVSITLASLNPTVEPQVPLVIRRVPVEGTPGTSESPVDSP